MSGGHKQHVASTTNGQRTLKQSTNNQISQNSSFFFYVQNRRRNEKIEQIVFFLAPSGLPIPP